MPSVRKASRYALWMYEAIDMAYTAGPLRIRTNKPAQLRREFYNFRTALRTEAERDPTNNSLARLTERANSLTFRVTDLSLLICIVGTDPYALIHYLNHPAPKETYQ